ncbi:hypothetical protein SASPL_135410 [Salvia splendens]|uniref:Uncharacterized protein n=1 Tax=Salvia splendens TaxID=180675 RepID=A0A8X8WXW9_SALSN|nr:hypothetical protein SASPL_135410 [Salvia splendens]
MLLADVSEFDIGEPADLCFSGDEHVFEDEDKENVADLGGGRLDFGTGSDTEREGGCQEPVAPVNAGTSLNGDAAFKTQTAPEGVQVGRSPVREDSTYAERQQGASVRRERSLSIPNCNTLTTRISPHGLEKRGIVTNSYLQHPTRTAHVFYSDDVLEVSKRKFSTLKPHEAVAVVDSWASYLNDMEMHKSTEKPSRLFVTTSPTTGVADMLDNVVPDNGILDWNKYGSDLNAFFDAMKN